MPQPLWRATALEAIKFAAGEAVTWLSAVLSTFRAEGTGDVVMREVPLLDRAFASTTGSLALLRAVLQSIKIDVTRMRTLASCNWSTATELADLMVREHNISFRTAHNIVARFVRLALERGVDAGSVSAALLVQAAREIGVQAPELSNEEVCSAFDVEAFALSRQSSGSIHPAEIDKLLEEEHASLDEAKDWLAAQNRRVLQADEELSAAVERFVANPDSIS